jgi:3-isopropylmalate dehydrogenase
MKVAVFEGDGIGPEVMREAVRVLGAIGLNDLELIEGDVGAMAWRKHGHPLPPATLEIAHACDAILFGAVGDFDCDHLERHLRPEQAILGLRKELGLFANLRPAKVYAGLEEMSTLRPEIAAVIDMVIVRESNGDVYFGEKGIRTLPDGRRQGYDIMSYAEDEVRRIAHVGFHTAMGRKKQLCSVDKANVLETSQLWRDVVIEVSAEYPEVELSHLYVDNAAMQMVKSPGQFDVIVTGNMFGDILSDQASMCVGSIGLLASATMAESKPGDFQMGLYEPIHGSAPDIAGKGIANPMAQILSAAMMLRHSFGKEAEALRIEGAVANALADGIRGGDLGGSHGTTAIGDAILVRL